MRALVLLLRPAGKGQPFVIVVDLLAVGLCHIGTCFDILGFLDERLECLHKCLGWHTQVVILVLALLIEVFKLGQRVCIAWTVQLVVGCHFAQKLCLFAFLHLCILEHKAGEQRQHIVLIETAVLAFLDKRLVAQSRSLGQGRLVLQ